MSRHSAGRNHFSSTSQISYFPASSCFNRSASSAPPFPFPANPARSSAPDSSPDSASLRPFFKRNSRSARGDESLAALSSALLWARRIPDVPRRLTHAADFLAHQRLKDGIDKVKQPLAAAEIFSEVNGLPVFAAPALGVIAEDFRFSQPKTINALLHIADQKTVAAEFAARFFSLSSPKEKRGGVRSQVICEFNSPLPGPSPRSGAREKNRG